MPAARRGSSACGPSRSTKCAGGWATTTSSRRRSRRSASSTTSCWLPSVTAGGRRAKAVLERRRAQLAFADGLIAEEVTDLREPWMVRADAVLDDEEIIAAVYEALVNRHPQSRRRGRPGAPAEMVLRLLVLKHIRNWSYAVLEREVRANLV